MKPKDLFEKYVSPHLWEGSMWADGGWGPKNKILELADTNLNDGMKRPLYLMPFKQIRDYRLLDAEGNECEASRGSDERYHVAFPGAQWKALKDTIRRLAQPVDKGGCGVEEQRWLLNSYLSTQHPGPKAAIYRLVITVKKGAAAYKILEGEWVPSFVDSKIVAGW